jgi:hypothetical protein
MNSLTITNRHLRKHGAQARITAPPTPATSQYSPQSEELGGRPAAWLVFVIHLRERLAVMVLHNEAGAVVFDRPWRREATSRQTVGTNVHMQANESRGLPLSVVAECKSHSNAKLLLAVMPDALLFPLQHGSAGNCRED